MCTFDNYARITIDNQTVLNKQGWMVMIKDGNLYWQNTVLGILEVIVNYVYLRIYSLSYLSIYLFPYFTACEINEWQDDTLFQRLESKRQFDFRFIALQITACVTLSNYHDCALVASSKEYVLKYHQILGLFSRSKE